MILTSETNKNYGVFCSFLLLQHLSLNILHTLSKGAFTLAMDYFNMIYVCISHNPYLFFAQD